MLRLKWLAIGFVVAFAAVGAYWIWSNFKGPTAAGKRLSDALEEGLHARPTVYLSQHVVVEEKRPIAELALVSRPTSVEHRMERELLYSKAQLVLRADFNVKAGFDLRSPQFTAHLDSGLKKAGIHLPSPRVLSLEMTRYEVLEDRSGWWSKISNSDRETALRQMQAEAKLEAIRAGLLADCKKEIEQHLSRVSKRAGMVLEYRYWREDSTPVFSEPGSAPDGSPR